MASKNTYMEKSATTYKMSIAEKGEYIKNNMRKFRKHCTRNHGQNIGFLFPDGSRITPEESAAFLYF